MNNKLVLKEQNLKGKLITFCGLDGSGKTSMITRLTQELKQCGITPVLTKQPTPALRKSEIFRNFMDCDNHEYYDYRALSLMAASDRIQHVKEVIMPKINVGELVISDRYFYSCLANLQARGYSEDQWIYEIARNIPKPTMSFFMDVPVEEAVKRVRQRPEEKERYIDMDLQYRLREEYLNIAKEVGGVVISTVQSEKESFEQIWETVISLCKTMKFEYNQSGTSERVLVLLKNYTAWEGEIKEDMDIDQDLGMDSLRRVQLVCDIEEKFGIEFGVKDLEPNNFKYVRDICGLVDKYVG